MLLAQQPLLLAENVCRLGHKVVVRTKFRLLSGSSQCPSLIIIIILILISILLFFLELNSFGLQAHCDPIPFGLYSFCTLYIDALW